MSTKEWVEFRSFLLGDVVPGVIFLVSFFGLLILGVTIV